MRYLTQKELARERGVTTRTIRRWLRAGRVAGAARVGQVYRIMEKADILPRGPSPRAVERVVIPH